MDWLGSNLWALWFAAAVILAVCEMLTLDFTLLMLAAGAAAAGLTALVVPGLPLVQVVVGIVVAVALLGFLRPTLLRRVRNAPGYRSQLEALTGHVGTADTMITSKAGEIRVNGETWTARALEPSQIIEPGAHYRVEKIDGTTAYVSLHRELGAGPAHQ